MDKMKGIAKGGWHSDKIPGRGEGGGGTMNNLNKDWKTGFGLRDRGKDPYEEQRNHTSAPLTSLKDPDSFGPPPKHSAYYGGQASPARQSAPSNGLGGPVPRPAPRRTQEEIEAEEEAERIPRGPYQRDTTGLRTDNLPPPPVRRDHDSPAPPTPSRSAAPATPPRGGTPASSRPVPSLPPRLPPRQNEYPDENTPAPPPTYNDAVRDPQPQEAAAVNPGAANRLGHAGVSVPGFGIGGGSQPTPPESPQKGPQLSELQSRFARMNSNNVNQEAGSESQGTTWQQKQDALQTAQNFRNNPSSISMSDARSAATTANSFQQRHGAQVASAAQSASGLNQKYGISQRLGGLAQQAPARPGQYESPPATPTSPASAAAGKKAPPPPPPKKAALTGVPTGDAGGTPRPPPPIPHLSKPH